MKAKTWLCKWLNIIWLAYLASYVYLAAIFLVAMFYSENNHMLVWSAKVNGNIKLPLLSGEVNSVFHHTALS